MKAVKADFSADSMTIKNVGVRYKGNFTYIASAQMLRRPLKIDLDHFDETARLHSQRKLNFANGVTAFLKMRFGWFTSPPVLFEASFPETKVELPREGINS